MDGANGKAFTVSQKRRRTDSFDQDETFSCNNSDEPIDLSKGRPAVNVPPTEVLDEESNNSAATTSSSEYSFQSYFSSFINVADDFETSEDSNENNAAADASSSAPRTNESLSQRKLLFAAKNPNICTIFQNEALRKELVDRLIKANADAIECHSPNVSMARTFVHVERTEREQIKREQNTEAARRSRKKRAILEKVVNEMAESKEILHKQLLAQKAAMINYCNQLDKLL